MVDYDYEIKCDIKFKNGISIKDVDYISPEMPLCQNSEHNQCVNILTVIILTEILGGCVGHNPIISGFIEYTCEHHGPQVITFPIMIDGLIKCVVFEMNFYREISMSFIFLEEPLT